MNSYIAFLRGINVSGQKKIPMQTLRDVCVKIGLSDVQTYIQSGNILFKSALNSHKEIESLLCQAIEDKFGFTVSVLVKTQEQLAAILDKNPFISTEAIAEGQVYFVLLSAVPSQKLIEGLKNENFKNETFFLTEQCLYLHCALGYGKAKLNNNLIEKRLQITTTTRNYKTMKTLLKMSLVEYPNSVIKYGGKTQPK